MTLAISDVEVFYPLEVKNASQEVEKSYKEIYIFFCLKTYIYLSSTGLLTSSNEYFSLIQ